jgi:hypothetical protein
VNHWLAATVVACHCIGLVEAAEPPKPAASAAVNRVRFFPASGREQAMVGGKITGSNVSDREGFEPIAEITATPTPGQWGEITFPNARLYRWIRYEAPPGSHGNVAELEFYSDHRPMPGKTFGSFGWRQNRNWPRAFDKNTETFFDSDAPDGQYLGIDVGEAATAQMPRMDPPPGDGEPHWPVQVSLRCTTPGAVVRYSFTGAPGPGDGTIYEAPIPLDHRATIFAVAFKDGVPPSPVACGTYLAGTPLKPGLHSFHVGNSLTASLLPFARLAVAAGYDHDFHSWLKNGGSTPIIWQNTQSAGKADWDKELAAMPGLDHFSVQPRLPGFTDADLANEAKFEALFFDLARAKSPQVQPWIYSEWPSRRPGFNGWVPPFTTFEEACAALLMCSEKIQRDVCEISSRGKRPRILPCTLAVAHFRQRLEHGGIPGLSAPDFDPVMFYDNVHPGDAGRYLLCLTWFAAFYGESPVGKIPPVNMSITAAQADALQRLAWDVVKNYPDCGLYEEGTTPCGKPEFASDGRIVTLQSATPGAWFRYTLDGTVPTRTRGYVYCGVISVQPGIAVKAIAYKSGMADSEVAEQ